MTAPVTSASQVYTWEPSDAAIAARYGIAVDRILRFDTNTSPTEPAVAAEVLRRATFAPTLNEYPDSQYAELADAAAAYVGVPRDEVIVGAGADEVLDLGAKSYLTAETAALVPVPTYGMYAVLTAQRGARAVQVPRLPAEGGFLLDVPRVVERLADVAVVWLCAPNNPTGADEPLQALEAVIDAAAALGSSAPIVVVDEAYHEWTGTSVVEWRHRYPNLIVVRTLSKAFALAGIRVGYAVATRKTIATLERVRPPGSISTVSATIAAAALRNPAYAARNVARASAERDRLAAGLDAAGWTTAPSATNFLLVRIGDAAAAARAADRLLRAGIVPRTFDASHPLAGYLRLTVRTPAEDDRLLEAIG